MSSSCNCHNVDISIIVYQFHNAKNKGRVLQSGTRGVTPGRGLTTLSPLIRFYSPKHCSCAILYEEVIEVALKDLFDHFWQEKENR